MTKPAGIAPRNILLCDNRIVLDHPPRRIWPCAAAAMEHFMAIAPCYASLLEANPTEVLRTVACRKCLDS